MKNQKIKLLEYLQKLSSFLLLLTLITSTSFAQESEQDIRPLPINKTIERSLKGSESHTYKITLKKGQVLRIDAIEKGINIQINILQADNKENLKTANFGFGNEREILTFIAEESKSFYIKIESAKSPPNGIYELIAKVKKIASNKDKERFKAERLLIQGFINANKGTAKELKEGITKWEKSLPIWKRINEKYWEGHTNEIIGLLHNLLGKPQKSLDYFNRALSLRRTLGDKNGEAVTLNNIGAIYNSLGEKRKALDYLNQTLPLRRSVGDKNEESLTLNNIGVVYDNLGEKQKALDFYNQALPLGKIAGDKSRQATILNNIGGVYSSLGEKQKALDFYNQALPLRRVAGDKNGEVSTLNNIGAIYSSLGEKQKALDYYNQALPLSKAIGDKNGEAITLHNIGAIYNSLGEKRKALDYYNQALPLSKAIGDKHGEAKTLNNIGAVYDDLGEKQKALDYLNQTLPLRRVVGDKHGEATTLNNIGTIHNSLDEKQKALDFYSQVLPLRKATGDKSGEAVTLNNIGAIYSSLGEKQKALDYYNQALPLRRVVGDKNGESVTLNNLMVVWTYLGNSRLSLFYGKQSVTNYQQLRGSVKGLNNEIQKSFLKTLQHTYQKLVELLIKEREFSQAVQVLNLYQDQQFFDFDRDSNSPVRQVSLSPREVKFANLYEASADKVGQIGFQLDEIKRNIGNRQLTEIEKKQLANLEAELKSATDSFLKVLKDAEIEFSQKADDKDKVPSIKDVSEMQSALQELSSSTKQKTAAIYTLIGEKKFYVLLMVEEGPIKVFSSAIEAGVLNNKLIQFFALLQTPAYDSKILGKELHDILIPKELEKELKKQKIKTLMWSLDGNLRYIPMSALSPDGKKYLVEKYQNVVFTRADKTRMTKEVSPKWTGVGFGSSNAHKVDLLGDENLISFKALSGVKKELASIFQTDKKNTGVLNGEVLEDKKFTKEKFYEALKEKREVVHISSHFRFYPGDSSLSFLLLGDGKTLTLNELKKKEKLFEGVELLTLSACETAAILPNADGREIDGFAELAQRLGANAVLATLWQVRDVSTAELMTEFYTNR